MHLPAHTYLILASLTFWDQVHFLTAIYIHSMRLLSVSCDTTGMSWLAMVHRYGFAGHYLIQLKCSCLHSQILYKFNMKYSTLISKDDFLQKASYILHSAVPRHTSLSLFTAKFMIFKTVKTDRIRLPFYLLYHTKHKNSRPVFLQY